MYNGLFTPYPQSIDNEASFGYASPGSTLKGNIDDIIRALTWLVFGGLRLQLPEEILNSAYLAGSVFLVKMVLHKIVCKLGRFPMTLT
jgi:hypothetical protein